MEINRRSLFVRTAQGLLIAEGARRGLYTPKTVEAQSGCNPIIVGPFDGNNPDPEKRIVRAGNSVVQLEVWAPTYGLGADPVQTIVDRNNFVLEYSPNTAGQGWKYGETCGVDQVRLTQSQSGRRYFELGELLQARALVQLTSEQVIGTPALEATQAPVVIAPSEVVETEEGDCREIEVRTVTPEDRNFSVIDTGDSVTRFQVYAPHKGVDPLANSIIDRSGIKIKYADGATGIWWRYNNGCSIFDVAEMIGNGRFMELGELVQRGAVELLPR